MSCALSTFNVGLSRARASDVGINNANADPGVQEFLVAVRVWFRDYKLPDGKPANTFAFDDKYQSKVSVMVVLLSIVVSTARCRRITCTWL